MEEKYRKILVELIFLGLTPAFAATINTVSAVSMEFGIIFIMVMSTLTMRLLRRFVTEENKYFVTLIVTTLYSSIFQMVTEAYFIDAYKNIGMYIALCSINMMLFGVAQGATGKEEKHMVAKVLLFSLIFGFVIYFVGSMREIMGVGTYWGQVKDIFGEVKFANIPVKYFSNHKVLILQKAPGAYIVGSIATAIVAYILKKTAKKKEAK